VLDLESKVASLEEELSNHGGGAQKRGKEDALPKGPAQYSLTGHRNSVNAVRFHPTFSLVASASEDATVKISFQILLHDRRIHYYNSAN
jgi:platelet-activating factor acetylhydrolase IB subunit alpha